MSRSIYDQHDAAFSGVSAYVVLDAKGERVATIAFKFPRDGAGRLYCYLHVFGVAMVRGYASGYGYDKRSAAAHSAVQCVDESEVREYLDTLATIKAMKSAICNRGTTWDRELEAAGFKVYQAV